MLKGNRGGFEECKQIVAALSLRVKATVFSIHFTEAEGRIAMDMTGAYDTSVLNHLVRNITDTRLRDGSADIVDAYDIQGAVQLEEAITTDER